MTPLLELRNLTRDFGGLRAVNGVSLQVEAGSIFGLVGPNGAGKTTLFHTIAGVHVPTSGQVLFEGRSIGGRPSHAVCRLGIARTFQIVKPMAGMSVLDNVVVGALLRESSVRQARGLAQECLYLVGLSEVSANAAGTLSIGGRKRLELARALATRPRLLLLDEVMGGLIPKEVTQLMEVVRSVRQSGVTIVLIEHVMRAVMGLCERLAVLDHGEKIADGTPEEVTRDPRVIEAYMGVQ